MKNNVKQAGWVLTQQQKAEKFSRADFSGNEGDNAVTGGTGNDNNIIVFRNKMLKAA